MPQGKVIAVQPARTTAPTTLAEESLKKAADEEVKPVNDSTTDNSATTTDNEGDAAKTE